MRLGVDVGGTHTDAVVLSGGRVLASAKVLTSADIRSGIMGAIDTVLAQADVARAAIEVVMLGTTQFTNAVVERRHLARTAAIRLGAPATTSVPPMSDWPADLKTALGGHGFIVHGGHHYDGSTLTRPEEREVDEVAEAISELGLQAAGISSVFAPVNDHSERWFAEALQARLPELDLTLSSELGRLGLLERESATLLNASLKAFAREVVAAFEAALASLEIRAGFYLSQNDGTLMSAEHAMTYPVLTFSSGPTNSMRGAAYLSGLSNAVVIDVGGTTADIGMLIDGFPRESSLAVEIGGVLTNFRMPDVLALGLGGGTVVSDSQIGPQSVGHELTSRARVFGGDVLTATDIAVAAGLADIGDAAAVASLDPALVSAALERMRGMLADGIDRVKTASGDVTVIAVGGGQFLVPDDLAGVDRVLRPEHAAVANAIGAGLAEVSGEAELIYARSSLTREDALAQTRAQAEARALGAGAQADSLRLAELEEVAMAYMAEGTDRLRVKVVGKLAVDAA